MMLRIYMKVTSSKNGHERHASHRKKEAFMTCGVEEQYLSKGCVDHDQKLTWTPRHIIVVSGYVAVAYGAGRGEGRGKRLVL